MAVEETKSIAEWAAEAEAERQKKWKELRKPFDAKYISHMPRGGVTLDYVGHAHVTDRLNNAVGPDGWNWGPSGVTEFGAPAYEVRDQTAVMWGWFEVLGVKKVCVGTAQASKFELEKELIGDLIRNGAMRFGVALDLWAKGDLESQHLDDRPKLTPPGGVPISKLTWQKLKLAMEAADVDADMGRDMSMHVIGKPRPETEDDVAAMLAEIAKRMTK